MKEKTLTERIKENEFDLALPQEDHDSHLYVNKQRGIRRIKINGIILDYDSERFSDFAHYTIDQLEQHQDYKNLLSREILPKAYRDLNKDLESARDLEDKFSMFDKKTQKILRGTLKLFMAPLALK